MIPGRGWKWRKQKDMKERGTEENCIKSLDVDLFFTYLFIYFLKTVHAGSRMASGLGSHNLL